MKVASALGAVVGATTTGPTGVRAAIQLWMGGKRELHARDHALAEVNESSHVRSLPLLCKPSASSVSITPIRLPWVYSTVINTYLARFLTKGVLEKSWGPGWCLLEATWWIQEKVGRVKATTKVLQLATGSRGRQPTPISVGNHGASSGSTSRRLLRLALRHTKDLFIDICKSIDTPTCIMFTNVGICV